MKRKNIEGGFLQQTLRRRVESCKAKYSSTPENIVKYLRSTYSDYHRTKPETLIRLVRKALNTTHNNDSDNGESDGKKSKKMDVEQEKEEILQMTTTPTSCDSSVLASDGEKVRKKESSCDSSVLASDGEKVRKKESSCNSSVLASDGEKVRKKESSCNSSVLASDGEKVRKKEPMFKDLGGMKNVIEELKNKILWPMFNPNMSKLGGKPIGGVLLHGLPGCGKTRLAHAIANETGYNFYSTSATQFVSGISGSSEESIRELFSTAKRTAPSVIFIDEIDAIASKRENLQRQMETRIVTQLMICMDEANDHHLETSDKPRGHVLVIGATNKPGAIESALRRPGRFDREILVPIPDQSSREEILTVVTRHQKHDNSVDLQKIAMSTPGFVAADLEALANEACIVAMDRLRNETKHKLSSEQDEDWWKEPLPQDDLEKCAITMSDFEEASKKVQPSLTREGFAPIPDVKWEDVGALDHVRQEFDHYIIRRIKHPEDFKGFTRNLETGFLLFGPPGCGKTLIAKAVANKAGANFIHVKGPELLNKFVGTSEHDVRKIFSRARTCAPCIIFFDELDALTKERGKEGGQNIEGVLNQLLIELDGAENRKGVFVIGATNRFDVIDHAILRPGRFGKHLYVPLPSPDERVKILKTLAKDFIIDASVDLNVIGRMEGCENFSGADLAELLEVAGMAALIEKWDSTEETSGTIKTCHFEAALIKISPSVSAPQRQYYQHISKSLKFK
ncbi:unnamed protein product [Lathyrus sativus]|nr:unnamed protein product [Lathyrus sativus]